MASIIGNLVTDPSGAEMGARATLEPRRAAADGRSVAAWPKRVWPNPRVAMAAASVLVAAWASVSVSLTPRGPVTTAQALWAMGSALIVGVLAGYVAAGPWSFVVLPFVFVLAFEAGRVSIVGPTVDAIHLDAFYGIVAFVVGRVLHGVLVLLPLEVGVSHGAWLASRAGHPRATSPGRLRWALTAVGSLATVALAAAVARPATTAPIVGADGEPIAGSVAELVALPIGGHQQMLMIRGRDVSGPVLLYLAGGPGGTDLGAVRRDVGLEEDFVVAVWEQRGAGKSYAALDPAETLTVDQLVSDTIEVTDYLRERFGVEKVFLVGQSWGSTLGVLAVQARPDLYYALVGVGQMVSQRATDVMFWEDTLAWAEATGDEELAAALRRNGPPPYAELLRYDPVVSHEHDWNSYPELDLSNEMPGILFVPEYSFMDRVNAFRGFLDTNATLYPQLQEIDFRRDVPSLGVPFYMVLGEHEARGRAVVAEEWFAMVEAPMKERFVIEGAGHRAHFDRPPEFRALMRHVLEQSAPR